MFKQYIYSKQTIDVIKRLPLQPTHVTSSPGLPYLIWRCLQILEILGGSGPHVTPLGSASVVQYMSSTRSNLIVGGPVLCHHYCIVYDVVSAWFNCSLSLLHMFVLEL